MYRSFRVAVVIPAYNEERLIKRTLDPASHFVDAVYVVDDASKDRTAAVVLEYSKKNPQIQLLQHSENRGVGAAIITGYKQAYKDGHDIFVVMGGDAQMDWNDLSNLLNPIVAGKADYTKGNRFIFGNKHTEGNAWREMPTHRILGNVTLSILTKIASGYYHLYDSQMGYTAMHRDVFPLINWKKARQGYGYPAEWLIRMHRKAVRVLDVPVRAIYLENERQTQIRVQKFLFYMTGVLIKGLISRLYNEYLNGKGRKLMNNYRHSSNNLKPSSPNN